MTRLIHTILFACCLLCLSLTAEEITLSPTGQKNWQSPVYKIQDKSLPLQVKMEYICTGSIRHHILLEWFDKQSKKISTFMLRPPFHYPVPEKLNKKLELVQTVLPDYYPKNAEAVRISISSGYFPGIPSKAHTTFINPRLEWVYRIVSSQPLNWFNLSQKIEFNGILPPGKTGFCGSVFDNNNKLVTEATSNNNKIIFNIKNPGFYTVKFYWLDKSGKKEPILENYYFYTHERSNNKPVLFKDAQSLTRDFQNFAVTVKPPSIKKEKETPFGLNILSKSDFHSYSFSYDDKLTAAKLLGSDNFFRYHAAKWYQIETKPGKYNWNGIDELMKVFKKHGISQNRIIMNTYGTPRWNSPKPNNTLHRIRFCYFAPLKLEPWGNYLTAFSKRYPGIQLWELWNEPHLPGKSIFWQESSPQQFVDLLKTGYNAIKKADPQDKVILGGISMRYMPFYDQFVKLGGIIYMDMIGTHNGIDHTPFREVETKYNAKHLPFVETEWHVNLYNCNIPVLPSEEELCFKLGINLVNFLNIGKKQIAAFNTFTGSNVPEAARFKQNQPGIQQISGLFRSFPRKEPRKSALALRTITDQFQGEVTALGAWYFGDGNQQAALFSSKSGIVLLFWSQEGKQSIKLSRSLSDAIGKEKILDWQGLETSKSKLLPRHVYIVRNPDITPIKKGEILAKISPRPPAPELSQKYQGVISKAEKPIFHELEKYISRNKAAKSADFKARFAVSANHKELKLIAIVQDKKHCPDVKDMSVWNGDSVQFAIDVEGNGFKEDIIEFAVGKGNLIFKSKMPAIKGDLPAKFSRANIPLTESKVITTRSGNTTTYEITVADSDFYPFIYQKDKPVRFSILVNNNNGNGRDGYLEWSSGIGYIKAPHLYGTLTMAGYNKIIAVQSSLNQMFQAGNIIQGNPVKVSAERGQKASGVQSKSIKVKPGMRYRFNANVKGNGKLEIMAYGSKLKRTSFKNIVLTDKWQDVTGEVTIPADNKNIRYAFFVWNQPEATFEVKDFTVSSFK